MEEIQLIFALDQNLNGLYYLCKVSLYRFLWWWAPAAPMYVFSHLLLAAIEKKHGGLLKKVMALYLISFIDFLSSSLNSISGLILLLLRNSLFSGRISISKILSIFSFVKILSLLIKVWGRSISGIFSISSFLTWLVFLSVTWLFFRFCTTIVVSFAFLILKGKIQLEKLLLWHFVFFYLGPPV